MTNPQGPPDEGPSTWARPGNQGPYGQPPTERLTQRINTGGPGQAPPWSATPNQAQQTERLNASHAGRQRPDPTTPPLPPAGPTERIATPGDEPPPAKKKRRLLRDPLSILLICVIIFALLIAGFIATELYIRHKADTKVAEAVACEVKDQATASFGVTPLMIWQYVTKRYTNISVQTAGNNLRDAKGMKLTVNVKDVQLKSTADSKGTIGSLDATISWTTDGIKQSVQNAIPVLGPFVTNSVKTHPADGTVELKGLLDDIVAKPTVSGNGLALQIQSFNALGFKLPRESVQSTLDDYMSNLTKNFPLGIHADSVQVTDSGVTSHFSTQNATIPSKNTHPCFANL